MDKVCIGEFNTNVVVSTIFFSIGPPFSFAVDLVCRFFFGAVEFWLSMSGFCRLFG